jgi:RNA polymerase sigma-70 factor (ECF subfamily)
MAAVSRLTQWIGAALGRPAEPDPGNDWQLWHQARAGHAPSARQLVRQLTPQALGLALHWLGRHADAEDVVQEAFVRLWRSAPTDTHGARLSTYFNTIVINRCRSLLVARREEATDPDALAELHDDWQLAERDHGPASTESAMNTPHADLASALARLPVRQRMAITMWAYADASVPEIALALELDPNATHQLLHRARQTLKQHLTHGTS